MSQPIEAAASGKPRKPPVDKDQMLAWWSTGITELKPGIVNLQGVPIQDLIGKVGGTPDFSNYAPGGVSVGAFLTALISFLIMAAVVYFLIIVPYTKAKERFFPSEEEGTPADVALLETIAAGSWSALPASASPVCRIPLMMTLLMPSLRLP